MDTAPAPACTRRALLLRSLTGAGVVLAPGVLAACGSEDSGTATAPATPGTVGAASVPVGHAVVVRVGGAPVVLAQPEAGTYVAYSAVCTHQGGVVQAARSGTVVTCPLHGSEFDAGADGDVVRGPATTPLPTVRVAVEGDRLRVG